MQHTRHRNDIFAYLLLASMILAVVCLIGFVILLCMPQKAPEATPPPSSTADPMSHRPVGGDPTQVELPLGEDAGMAYIDSMIFFGESTTTHLRARGVLTGGTDTKQVWADSSGTKTLSARMLQEPIIYPPTGELLTLEEALKREQPAIMVLSFGLNNINAFAANTDTYINNYKRLIDLIGRASPDTKIILQTVYPVSATPHGFSQDGATICAYIDKLNACLPTIAAAYTNVRVADTASVLKETSNGMLLPAYDESDGVHLKAAAYQEIIHYLRTHPWVD